jgi:hypothetical protein
LESSSNINDNKSLIIRPTKARRWLDNLVFYFENTKKNIYIDSNEKQDVIEYRKNIFLPKRDKYSIGFIIFNEDGTWNLQLTISPSNKPVVLITLDESTFNANDGKH